MADRREDFCALLDQIGAAYPAPALFDDLRRAIRQAEETARVVGEGGAEIEEAAVSAWLAILYHEAHAVHAALDTLKARYCEGSR